MEATKDPDLEGLNEGRFVGGAWSGGLASAASARAGRDAGQSSQQPCGQDTRLQQQRVCSDFSCDFLPFKNTIVFQPPRPLVTLASAIPTTRSLAGQ